ncbi:MAG: DNA gyrase C-terminal beta-propeller domain-containing protein, partial [Bacteroidota bacterium]|nr:DNA gyrase C-terminal beta-propeller domain-containing protein [Bacteroidota bacterium]
VIGAIIARSNTHVLVVSERGYGKRSEVSTYRLTRRGGKGVITMRVTEKTGPVIAVKEVTDEDDLVVISTKGMVIRQHIRDIRVMGRNTQGVRLIQLKEGDSIADVARVSKEEETEGENGVTNEA